MMRVMALAVAIGLVLSGCTQPTEDEASEDDGSVGPVVAPLDVTTDPSGCKVGGLILPTPFADLAPHLPPGFTPRDVQAMLGTPVPVGEGGVAVFHLDCASSLLGEGFQTAEVLIIVEPPAVNGTLSPTTIDFYAAGMHVAPGPLHDILAGAGWDLLEGADQVDIGMTVAAAQLSASFADADGVEQWSFGTTSPAKITFANFERIWYDAPGGLSFIENDYDVEGYLGPAACALAAGGPVATVVARTACEPGDVAAAAPEASWSARVVTLPGVFAE